MGFKTDFNKCIGCEACVVACNQFNNAKAGVSFRKVVSVNSNRVDSLPSYQISVSCNHCENPKCLEACKNKAYRILDNGTVYHDASLCKGCRDCISACPYDAPKFDDSISKSSKCNLCVDSISEGETPFCVNCCPTGALSITENPGHNDMEEALKLILRDIESRKRSDS